MMVFISFSLCVYICLNTTTYFNSQFTWIWASNPSFEPVRTSSEQTTTSEQQQQQQHRETKQSKQENRKKVQSKDASNK